jgi:rubrerythrin
MTTTPIENRALWKTHHAAMDAAKAKGSDFHCATECGFAAVEKREPKVCPTCQRRGLSK